MDHRSFMDAVEPQEYTLKSLAALTLCALEEHLLSGSSPYGCRTEEAARRVEEAGRAFYAGDISAVLGLVIEAGLLLGLPFSQLVSEAEPKLVVPRQAF